MLPDDLRSAIDAETASLSLRDLRAAVAELTAAYEPRASHDDAPALRLTPAQRLAYVVTRMPATYAAIHAVLTEVGRRCPGQDSPSLLDLGAGPGTALWAARAVWPSVTEAVLVERDAGMAEIGERLWSRASAARPAVRRIAGDVRRLPKDLTADVVLMSYVAAELGLDAPSVLERAWRATRRALVVVEAGTPKGAAVVGRARDQGIALGGHVALPCPHGRPCPLTGNDWCHFSVRLSRSSRHRRAKAADLGWEDEKFSYVVLARAPGRPAAARILRHPEFRKGHVALRLCTEHGLDDDVVSKREGDRYRAARHARWGDGWDESG